MGIYDTTFGGTKDGLEDHDEHFHNREVWFGKSADQSGNDWGADNLTAYQCISGNGVYGADPNDEAKVLGTDDTPMVAGKAKFDIRRIQLIDVSANTVYKLRIVYGDDTMANAIAAGQYSEIMLIKESAAGRGFPVHVLTPKLRTGVDKVWIQCKNATDNATLDFFVGVHEYNP